MASAALGEELSCSICLNLYTEPVSLRCGHNFCRNCIGTALDTQDGSGVYSCPECREQYAERPTPEKNRKLCNIVENFRSTQQKEEKSEVFCTYCVDSPVRAVKTCLQCETSMCDKHLTAHNKTVDHVLVEPTSSFSGKKCSIHKKLLEYYCSEDTACLCVSCCLVGKHKGHEVELLEDALEKKKENLRRVLETLTTKRETTEQKIQSLQDQKGKVQTKEEDEKKRVSALFEDLRRHLEVQEQKVLSEISRQVEETSLSVSGLIRQLEIQKDELSRKICHIEKLCDLTDPITVLRDHKSDTDKVLQDQGSDTGGRIVEECSTPDLDEFMISLVLHRSISDLFCDIQLKNNLYTQDSTNLLLDEKTAHNYVVLSDDLRRAMITEIQKIRPKLSERFTTYGQVMSVESFSHGRHYWEVEVSDCGDWDVAVCYPSMNRKEDESGIGSNKKSWSFNINDNKYAYLHDSQKQMLKLKSPVQRLGLYLDYEKGRLSYYHLCDPIRHLHTFTTTFTEPLHAVFYLDKGAWVKFVSPVFSSGPSQDCETNVEPLRVLAALDIMRLQGGHQERSADADLLLKMLVAWVSLMASAALGDELSCSICLNLYTEPVSLTCGHNFCRDCIGTALDTQDGSGVYSCLECREEYTECPSPEKKKKLCNIVENFRSTQQKEEKSEVFCTYCVDSPVGAVKTCLHCETSMCDKHLTAHNKTVDHVLVEPTSSFSGKKCSIHKKLLEYYCSEDTACLCVSCCLVGKHKGHEVELLEDALEKKKENLRRVLETLTTKRETTEQKIQNLQDQKKKVQTKEDDEKKRVSALFEDLRRQLKVQEQKVLSEISRQVEEISLSVSGLIGLLEIQKDELSRKICHIEKLCNMTDPITVLRDHKSDTDKVLQDQESETGDGNVEESSVHELDDFMILLALYKSITVLITDMQLKNIFYTQDSTNMLLDEKSAHNNVVLSDDMRTAIDSETQNTRPELPERFTKYGQVMSVESFSHGRHYWEVEVGDSGDWDVAVCYPNMDRKEEEESGIGLNKKSWSFNINDNKYASAHDSQKQILNLESPVQRLGVYLDYEKGRLSFYQLCDPIRHLHTFTTTFSEPLHAAFYVYEGAWVKLVSPVFSVKL
ncbi:uncharacterized protein ACMZJ9_009966 [Mantella aurantiaca]